MDMNEIKEIFFQECEEQLAELETGLLAMNDGDCDPETVNAVFRAVHSIKGGAGAFALDELVAFAHVFETTLDCMRSNTLEPTPDVMKVMLRAADVLADLTIVSREGGSIDPSRCESLASELEALAKGEAEEKDAQCRSQIESSPSPETPDPAPAETMPDLAVTAVNAEETGFAPVPFSFDDFEDDAGAQTQTETANTVFRLVFRPHADLYTKGNEATLLLRDLVKHGETKIACDLSEVPLLDDLDPEGAYLSWTVLLTTAKSEDDIRAVFEFAEWDCDLTVGLDSEADPDSQADDDVGMQPVPFDLSVLDEVDDPSAEGGIVPEGGFEGPDDPLAAEAGQDGVNATAPEPANDIGTDARTAAIAAEVMKRNAGTDEAGTRDERTARSGGAAQTPVSQTIRVDLDRVDRLINLVGELVINQAMLSQTVVETDDGNAGSTIHLGLDELQQLTREIQDSVMAIRAQPVKPIFQRMSRTVREIADLTDKSVRLVTEGENTEVDKTVIDKLAEPLTHMIRNAVDHGLESPQERIAAGKNAEGVVRLAAKHRSGRIVIEIADDGAGIDRERVMQKAINRN